MKEKCLPFANLDALDAASGLLDAVVETPKGNRNKFKSLGSFRPPRGHKPIARRAKQFRKQKQSGKSKQ